MLICKPVNHNAGLSTLYRTVNIMPVCRLLYFRGYAGYYTL